jgi:hypothetical protein
MSRYAVGDSPSDVFRRLTVASLTVGVGQGVSLLWMGAAETELTAIQTKKKFLNGTMAVVLACGNELATVSYGIWKPWRNTGTSA